MIVGTISKKLIESFNYQINEADDNEQEILQHILSLQSSSDPEDRELAKKAMAKFRSGGGAAAPASAAAPAGQAAMKPGGNPKVAELQTALNAAGAKIAVDGLMGPQTQAALAANPAVAAKFPEFAAKKPASPERFAELMAKLLR